MEASSPLIEKASAMVDEGRLWRRHMELAQIGATEKGGVNRQALSAEDARARRLLVDWARDIGLDAFNDRIGNVFVRRSGTDGAAAPVLTGSHLDSQPTGGKFDGAYGVLAGVEALEAMNGAGVETRRAICVVAWTNEEGSRFQPGCMGSAVFSGDANIDQILHVPDWDGTSVGQALERTLAATPDLPVTEPGFPVSAYIEAHIEQGPLLEASGRTIGIVTGVQGARRYNVEVVGEEAHAGTAPLRARKDALRAAVAMVAALGEEMADDTDTVRFTVGRFDVSPGSPNTVPGRVRFTIDFRHPDASTIAELCGRIEPTCRAHAQGCEVAVKPISDTPPTDFDPAIIDTVRRHAARLNLGHMDMFSSAGHDAIFLAGVCPAGMIFVPCERGISHNEAENATPGDLAAGARVLTACLTELANS
ncbi:MAG: M20 family metallo-hydrolase [Alphaproteobacteria bacterium]